MTEMTFGVKLDEYKHTPSGGGGNFLSYLGDGVTTLQFLQEYNESLVVGFHFDKDEDGKILSFPCPGPSFRDKCPGCLSNDREVSKATQRIVIIARDEKTDYVNVYAMPISLKDMLERAWTRNNTILDRPFTIYREKVGQRVKYDMEREDPYVEIPGTDYDLPEVEPILKEMWRYGTDANYRAGEKLKRSEEKSDEEKFAPKKREASKFAEQSKLTNEDPAPFEGNGDFPRGEITEAEIRSMNYIALIRLASEAGIEFDESEVDSKQELADLIIEKLS